MVSCLIANMYPNAQRVDGSGGDEGRDVQIPAGDGIHIKELKSFTGRLNTAQGRRAQVERSLKRASQHSPLSWDLIVPINPTPGELEWFTSLQTNYDFPLRWRGLDWLNLEMAQRPFLARHFLGTANDEVVTILRELNKEQGALDNGFPDIDSRLRAFAQRIDELSPYYRLNVTFNTDVRTVELQPRYIGAERESPITVRWSVVYPTTDEGRHKRDEVSRVADFGIGDVELDPEYVKTFHVDAPLGLGRTSTGPTKVKLIAVPEQIEEVGQMRILDPEGRQLAALGLRFATRHAGLRGGAFVGTDVTGCLTVTLMADLTTEKLTFNYELNKDGHLPGDLLQVVRVLQHLHQPNAVEIRHGESNVISFDCPVDPPTTSEYIRFLEDVVALQLHGNCIFKLPPIISAIERTAIDRAARLLRGERIRIEPEIQYLQGDPQSPDLLEELEGSTAGHLMELVMTDYSVNLFGNEILLGETKMSTSRTRLRRQDAENNPSSPTLLIFEPSPESETWLSLVANRPQASLSP